MEENKAELQKTARLSFVYEDGENAADARFAPMFTGAAGSFFALAEESGAVVFTGLGKHEKCKAESLKDIAGKAAKKLAELKLKKAEVELGVIASGFGNQGIFELVQGLRLGNYSFFGYKQKKETSELELNYLLDGKSPSGAAAEAVAHAENLARGICHARDMVNIPANMFTPIIFAERVTEMFAGSNVTVEIFDEKQCADMKMGSFLAVGSSSSNPPRLIVMRYMNNPGSEEILGLVGKGLTFDSGGYSLKQMMVGMKGDMAGAAAVAGAMYAISKNAVKTNVVGVLVCCENMLSNTARVPGDVVTAMNGKTIEVLNTDAEGRLALADGLCYAARNEKATKLIDIATLTGSMAATLGKHIGGVFTNNEDFLGCFMSSSKALNEKYWQFPMDDVYRKMIKSDIADMKNSGERVAGSIFAACFLEEFVDNDIPWIHMDIAGMANVEAPVFGYHAKGATGFGVTALYAVAGGAKNLC